MIETSTQTPGGGRSVIETSTRPLEEVEEPRPRLRSCSAVFTVYRLKLSRREDSQGKTEYVTGLTHTDTRVHFSSHQALKHNRTPPGHGFFRHFCPVILNTEIYTQNIIYTLHIEGSRRMIFCDWMPEMALGGRYKQFCVSV